MDGWRKTYAQGVRVAVAPQLQEGDGGWRIYFLRSSIIKISVQLAVISGVRAAVRVCFF